MVQEAPQISSADKIKSQNIVNECEEAIRSLFGLPEKEKTREVQGTYSNLEYMNIVTSIAYDTNKIFKMLDVMPSLKKMGKITSITRREDNRLATNTFTGKQGNIRAEFTNGSDLFYIIQLHDGTYSCSTSTNINID